MTHVVIEVTGNKTLGVADGDTLQLVKSAATITFPKDVFALYDSIEVFRDTASTVSAAAATGVTINSVGLDISVKCGFAKFVLIDTNTWIGWGNLV